MFRVNVSVICLLLALATPFWAVSACKAKQAPSIPQILNDETFQQWRDFIHPNKDELAWERINWYTTLWTGLMAAQQQRKPLMFQSMTGHPCGTT